MRFPQSSRFTPTVEFRKFVFAQRPPNWIGGGRCAQLRRLLPLQHGIDVTVPLIARHSLRQRLVVEPVMDRHLTESVGRRYGWMDGWMVGPTAWSDSIGAD